MNVKQSLWLACLLLTGCARYAYFNDMQSATPQPMKNRATFELRDDRGQKDVLVLLALSGGGSRAAYFSSAVMLNLQTVFDDMDLLKQVDVISSVSGGSLPAAYYAISKDENFHSIGTLPAAACAHPKIQCQAEAAGYRLKLHGKLTDVEFMEIQNLLPAQDWHEFGRLYAQQEVASNRIWDGETVQDLMSRDYFLRWVGNWFWPHNIAKYWFTKFDRSDIMAETFSDNLYDVSPTGWSLTFADLNPERPYLILNATNATEKVNGGDSEFGSIFTFTSDDFFEKANSSIYQYDVARAVMASATFPVVFNYMTMRNYHGDGNGGDAYLHVFDGGNSDNLGLTSLKRLLLDQRNDVLNRYRHVVVILVDSYVRSRGVSRGDPDGRCAFCYVVDFNVVDAVDSLLEMNRNGVIQDFERMSTDKDCEKRNLSADFCRMSTADKHRIEEGIRDKLMLYHVRFADSKHRSKLESIPTHFRLTEFEDTGESHQSVLQTAADELISVGNLCLQRIKHAIVSDSPASAVSVPEFCVWPAPEVIHEVTRTAANP